VVLGVSAASAIASIYNTAPQIARRYWPCARTVRWRTENVIDHASAHGYPLKLGSTVI